MQREDWVKIQKTFKNLCGKLQVINSDLDRINSSLETYISKNKLSKKH